MGESRGSSVTCQVVLFRVKLSLRIGPYPRRFGILTALEGIVNVPKLLEH